MSPTYSIPSRLYFITTRLLSVKPPGPWSLDDLDRLGSRLIHYRKDWTALVLKPGVVLLGDAHASSCTMLSEARTQHPSAMAPFTGFRLDDHAQELLDAAALALRKRA